jgi:secondary thiamine-phosphate synthase enzyme
MRQHQSRLSVETRGAGLYEITEEIGRLLTATQVTTGLATVFCQHTSASLLIQENADGDVQRDLLAFFRRLVPDGDRLFIHTNEGPDDMPAHVKAALTQSSLSIPVAGGRLALGTWQGLFVFEHRAAPHRRHLILHVVGD